MNCFDTPISQLIPPALTTALALITLALAAAPYLAGQRIGPVDVPKVPRRLVGPLRIVGPVLVILVAVLLFVPLQVVLRQDCSRVRNPSAEEVIDDGSSRVPVYWTAGSWLPEPGARHELPTDQAHSGTRSFKLSTDTPNHLWWGQSVRLDPHSTYLLSAWIRAENVARSAENNDRGANIAIHFISPDKFPQSSEPLYDTGGEWRHVSLQFTTQNAKTEAEVLLQLGADSGMTSGVAWFDDVTLQKQTGDPIDAALNWLGSRMSVPRVIVIGLAFLSFISLVYIFVNQRRKTIRSASYAQGADASPVSVPTHEISFDYLPKNMLESGWEPAYPRDAVVKPQTTVEHDAPIPGSVAITAPAGHAYDYPLPRNARLSNRIAFTAKYLHDTMIFVRLNLLSEDGREERQKWVKISLGRHEKGYPTPKWEDQECTLVVRGTPVDGWRRLDLFLPDVTKKTWGKLGLIFEGITTIRLRGSLQISPICFYEESTRPS